MDKKNTLLLLYCIEKRKMDLRNPKVKKKDLWKGIKQEMITYGFTLSDEVGIERKFRNMKGTYKTIMDNKKRSSTGRGEVKWEYFEAMQRIFEEDKTINIEHTISSMPKSTSVMSTEASTSSSSTPLNVNIINNSTLRGPNLSSFSGGVDVPSLEPIQGLLSPLAVEQEQVTPKSGKGKKQIERGKQLYGLRKKQIEVEESRVKELQLLRKAIEESNMIQRERNNVLSHLIEQNK